MKPGDQIYQQYLNILNEELRPAMGCTEPIALAYAGAKARQLLGQLPERIEAFISGNIIKNVKSVIVPNTDGLHGIGPAICAGVVAGNADLELEVISQVSREEQLALKEFLKEIPVEIRKSESSLIFDIDLWLEKNGEVLLDLPVTESSEDHLTDKSCLSIEKIVEFADNLDTADVAECVGRQIRYNMAIAEEGLKNDWGANVGSVILHRQGQTVEKRACAYAAAGSDARMSGCEMPVIIISGSGNQGITASVPVVIYGRELGASDEEILRAVAVSGLVTIHQKTGIGRLSAYCGAISAGCGAGAGIAYLQGGGVRGVAHAVVNAVAILSGTICDGAKPSCAAKIAAAVDAGILGFDMYMDNQQFYGGDGIITKGADKTLSNIGRLAREGMRETDRTILEIMMADGCK